MEKIQISIHKMENGDYTLGLDCRDIQISSSAWHYENGGYSYKTAIFDLKIDDLEKMVTDLENRIKEIKDNK